MTTPPLATNPKRSWPLLLVAAAAFLPGFGVLFAGIGLTWALVSDRPRAKLAAILSALGGLLNLAGSALLVWQMRGDPVYAAASTAGAKQNLAKVVGALEEYQNKYGEYPSSLVVFTQVPLSLKFVNVTDVSIGTFKMPRLYQYRRSADGRAYDVYGAGLDGRPGTADDVRPELPDSVARRSGYRPSR